MTALVSNNVDIVSGLCVDFEKSVGYEVSSIYDIDIWEEEESLIKSLEDHIHTYSACAKLYKRKALDKVRFPVGYRVHEDSFFLFNLFLQKPKVAVIYRNVYKMVPTPGSASRSDFSDKFFDILLLFDKKIELIQKMYPELMYKTYNLRIKVNMTLLQNLCKTYDNKYKNQERQCIKSVIKYKKYFISATKADDRWFKIITLHLYYLYKIYFYLKKKGN